MDEAERRFRACTNRFKRDLTRIISRSIDGMVREARRAAAKQAAHDAKVERQALAQAKRDERVARKAAEKQARAEARKAKRDAAQAEKAQRAAARAALRFNGAGEQLELQLGLGAVRPKSGRTRVRADSILGAELADVASAGAGDRSTAGTLPSPGTGPRQPSERPLFVHKRARDGQIHALRRGARENAAPAPAETKPDTESRELP